MICVSFSICASDAAQYRSSASIICKNNPLVEGGISQAHEHTSTQAHKHTSTSTHTHACTSTTHAHMHTSTLAHAHAHTTYNFLWKTCLSHSYHIAPAAAASRTSKADLARASSSCGEQQRSVFLKRRTSPDWWRRLRTDLEAIFRDLCLCCARRWERGRAAAAYLIASPRRSLSATYVSKKAERPHKVVS